MGDWTGREDTILREGIARGASLADVGKLVGRTSSACRARARRLGVNFEVERRLANRANERNVADELHEVVRLIDRGISPAGVRLRVTRAIAQLEGGAA